MDRYFSFARVSSLIEKTNITHFPTLGMGYALQWAKLRTSAHSDFYPEVRQVLNFLGVTAQAELVGRATRGCLFVMTNILSARADRQEPLPMFRCPGHARTTTAPAGSSLIT